MKPHQAYAHCFKRVLAVVKETTDKRNPSTHVGVPRPVAHLGLVRDPAPFLESVPSPPRQVPVLTPAMVEYLQRIRELGAVEGIQGAVELNPTLLPVLAALHHVLAGGEVEVRVVRDGQPDLLQELGARVHQGLQEATGITAGEVVDAAV